MTPDELIGATQDDTATRAEKARARTRTMIAAGAVGVIVLIMLGLFWLSIHRAARTVASGVQPPPNIRSRQTLTANPQYAAAIRRQNTAAAARALRAGTSFVPQPIRQQKMAETVGQTGVARPPANLAASESTGIPPVSAQPEQPQPIVVRGPPPQTRIGAHGPEDQATRDRNIQALKQQMQAILANLQPVAQTIITYRQPAAGNRAPLISNVNQGAQPHVVSRVPVKPGDLYYAVTDTAVNSDIPGPVLVTLVQGPVNGAKALGTFQRSHGRLILQFNQIIMPDGTRYQIEGYAVDPKTSLTAVQTAADHHYLSRWGGLIAASFLAGYGQALQYSGATTTNSTGSVGTTTTTTYPNYGAKQAGEIAIGNAANQLQSIAQQNFARPTTVTLAPGTGIGVLITQANGGAAK